MKVVAARTPFAPAELLELRILRDFYVSMRWVVSNIVEPRVIILEIVDPTAFALIFADVSAIISTSSEAQWSLTRCACRYTARTPLAMNNSSL
jgi:hypothetical protein